MNRNRTLGLSALFLAIAVFVSASLVMAVHGSYAVSGRSPTISDALHFLQKA